MALKETNKNRKKKKETLDDMGQGNVTFPQFEKLYDEDFTMFQKVLFFVGVIGFISLFFIL